MDWNWLATLLSSSGVHFKFSNDSSKHASRDINAPVTKRKTTNKSEHSTKTKSKDTYNGQVIHSEGAVTVVQGDVNVNVHVPVDENGTIPAESLKVLAPFSQLFEKKQIAFLATTDQETVSDIKLFEQDPDVRGLLRFFKPRLNPNDHLRMRTGLYLKHLSENGRNEEVRSYWRQVTVNQRQRDRRIIELASAGYFATFFRPLYKQFYKNNPDNAQKRFEKEFEAILEDMRFAIFISSGRSVEDIYQTVINKAVRNIKYASETEVISLHAAGSQPVKNVKAAIIMLRDVFPIMNVSSPGKSANVIRVDIDYRKNSLDDDLLKDDLASSADL